MSRKSSFNLDRFYQELQRAESSLGKPEARRTLNSPLVKDAVREEKSKPLAAFKKELKSKELAKTKINLDLPYEQLRHTPTHVTSNYRFSELSSDHKQTNPYNNMRQKLQGWRKEEAEQSDYLLSQPFSKVQKSQVDQSQDFGFLEKTMETPANEQEEQVGSKQEIMQKLLNELTYRNEIFERVQAKCGHERSYYRKEDPSIRLQEHFRQHKLMINIIQELHRTFHTIDLGQLQDRVRNQVIRASESQQGLL